MVIFARIQNAQSFLKRDFGERQLDPAQQTLERSAANGGNEPEETGDKVSP